MNHQERLLRLTEKLSDIRVPHIVYYLNKKVITEDEKRNRLSMIENRLKVIENNLFEYQETFTKKLGAIKDSVSLQYHLN